MGRKRIEPEQKKIKVSICIKKRYLKQIKEINSNVSEFIDNLLRMYFKEL